MYSKACDSNKMQTKFTSKFQKGTQAALCQGIIAIHTGVMEEAEGERDSLEMESSCFVLVKMLSKCMSIHS